MQYYHGKTRRGAYFEGWYLKHQTRQGGALALIPALHIDAAGKRSASLQVITDQQAWWLEYPGPAFQACAREFQIRLGQSSFRKEEVRLDVDQQGLRLRGTLRYGAFTPPRSEIMGPFRFLPGMECVHGVLSMGHPVEGELLLNGQRLDFRGGVGYVETDRGRSFPRAYLWTQCLWQQTRCNSLLLSVAEIPLADGHFTCCICALRYEGREYRLATYRGARVERWSGSGAVIRQGRCRLSAELLQARACPLRAPVQGSMSRSIRESLSARVRYRFWLGEELLFEHTDQHASFEFADGGKPNAESTAI